MSAPPKNRPTIRITSSVYPSRLDGPKPLNSMAKKAIRPVRPVRSSLNFLEEGRDAQRPGGSFGPDKLDRLDGSGLTPGDDSGKGRSSYAPTRLDGDRIVTGSLPPQNRAVSGPASLTVVMPIRTRPASNSRELPMARHRRAKAEKKATGLFFLAAGWPAWKLRATFAAGCIVTLTRISPGELDDDNLPSASKSIRDAIAQMLGLDDAPRVKQLRWRYRQEKGRYAVHVHLETFTPEGE